MAADAPPAAGGPGEGQHDQHQHQQQQPPVRPPPPPATPGGFGSFHSGDVEVLIRLPASAYAPPPRPFPLPQLPGGGAGAGALGARPFGAAFRDQFLIDFGGWTFVNHGAFGGALAAAAEDAERWRRRCEAQPLRFIDRELFPQLVAVIRDVAAFIGAEPQDLVLLPNATTGLNIVITSVVGALKPGDAVYSLDIGCLVSALKPGEAEYSLDIGYGSVKKMLAVACAASGATHVSGSVALPLSDADEVVAAVEATLPAGAKLAVFDAVTSNSAAALPLERLVALCKQRGVPVLIDGAHALGQLPLDVSSLGADYFVTNCHKWLGGARGSALLWVERSRQAGITSLIVSHGSGCGFLSDFIWDGCRDYAPLLSLPAALAWWRAVGPERARAYMAQLCADAVALLSERWATGAIAPPGMRAAMACVEVPPAAAAAAQRQRRAAEAAAAAAQGQASSSGGEGGDGVGKGGAGGSSSAAQHEAAGPLVSADANWIQDTLHHTYAIEVPVKFLAGRLWVRVSAHVYNTLDDYTRLADAVLELARS